MSAENVSFYIKTERSFSLVRKYAWLVTVLVGIGGQVIPELGLLVPFIMIALILSSLFKGRYWCGNFCPHGSFFDVLLQPLSINTKIPWVFRSKYFIAAVFLFFIFNMGRNTINVLFTPGAMEIHQRLGAVFANTYLMVLLVGGLLAILVNTRTWCQFCPMGTIEVIFYKIGKALGITKNTDEMVTVEHPELCHKCGKCARVCPMQLEPYRNFSESHRFEDENCIRCYTCVNNCPAGILHMAKEEEAKEIRENTSLEGFTEAKYYEAEIKSIEDLKDDVREYTFKLLDPPEVNFDPGQFALVEIDRDMEMYRAYTISGGSEDKTELKVTVKRLEDGYGTNIFFKNFKEGDKITIKAPLGNELRMDPEAEELIFVANGIGITPFVSMVQSLFDFEEYDFQGKATLMYGVRYEEDLVYDDYFESLARENENFEYRKILSRPRTDKYRKGYVTEIAKEVNPSPNTKVYICGTPTMAKDVTETLKEKGVAEENIHYENFGV